MSLIPLENIDPFHIRHFILTIIASKIQAYLHLSAQVGHTINAACTVTEILNNLISHHGPFSRQKF